MATRRIGHVSTPSEVLPLQDRTPRPPTPSAQQAESDEVSPFADPGAAAHNPFADPSHPPPTAQPKHQWLPPPSSRPSSISKLSFGDSAGNFAPYEEHVFSPGGSGKEALRSPVKPKKTRAGYWDMDGTHARQRRRRLLLFGGISLLLLVIIAIILGVVLGKKKSTTSPSVAGPLEGTAGVVSFENPSDPSTYILDANLKNSFYGLDYIPLGAYAPECGVTQNNVTEDIVLLSQLTTRVRLYGADCGQAGMVLNAVRETGVNLEVFLGVNLTTNATSFYEQATGVAEALREYGTDHVSGVVVGNQFIATYLASHNTSDPNSQAGQNAAQYVSSQLASMRASLSALNPSRPIAVGTADGGNMFTPVLLGEVDFAMASVMPWRSNVSVGQAAGWTTTFFKDYALSTAQATSSSPPMYIGATGWPSLPLSSALLAQYPTASTDNLQTFMDSFVCSSNKNGTGYFWWEAFDEVWRGEVFGGVEGGWGLFTSDKRLKNITWPNCAHA